MAKEVASRVAGDETSAGELRERAERAAALIPSIHDRWSSLSMSESAPPTVESPQVSPAEPPEPQPNAALALERPADTDAGAPEPEEGSVSVTPILGIATETDAESAARPRFKTLMGVPRNDPEIDELAGLESAP